LQPAPSWLALQGCALKCTFARGSLWRQALLYSKRRTLATTPAEPTPPSSTLLGLARAAPGGGVNPKRGGVCVRCRDAILDGRGEQSIQSSDLLRLGGLFFGDKGEVAAVVLVEGTHLKVIVLVYSHLSKPEDPQSGHLVSSCHWQRHN
jgi:hypothetical protein